MSFIDNKGENYQCKCKYAFTHYILLGPQIYWPNLTE